ncbi:hypothetical protein [Haloprofundus halobius]|uniref:hypothetical protein n=1 Tax=Haloprofundus halobius TaxID=2876194 RepID=UPI001CCFE83B|nr:hypothetical protein [Haloprofundus halobius]
MPSTFLGILALPVGLAVYRYAYELTRFDEQMDAIGSKTRASDVEPAEWNVLLTKLFGAAIAAFGAYHLLGGLFVGLV